MMIKGISNNHFTVEHSPTLGRILFKYTLGVQVNIKHKLYKFINVSILKTHSGGNFKQHNHGLISPKIHTFISAHDPGPFAVACPNVRLSPVFPTTLLCSKKKWHKMYLFKKAFTVLFHIHNIKYTLSSWLKSIWKTVSGHPKYSYNDPVLERPLMSSEFNWGNIAEKTKKQKQRLHPSDTTDFPLHHSCWWPIHCGTSLSQHSVCVLTDSGSALPPALLLQELDAVVDVKLDGPPISLVAHQQGAKFQTALTVSLGWHSQLNEVPLEVSFHSDTLRLWPGTLQYATLSCEVEEELLKRNVIQGITFFRIS